MARTNYATGKFSTIGKLRAAVRAKAVPQQPPPNFYDPSLDSALRATKRGFGDTQADYTRDYGADGHGGRAFDDYTIGRGDILTQAQQAYQDLGTSRQREQEGFDTSTANVNRSFAQLANSQSQNASARGVMGGALIQAAQKRAANQDIQQGALNTDHQQHLQDFQTAQSRQFGDGTPDFTNGTVGGSFGESLGKLGLGYQRNTTDAGTGLERAKRETGQFGIDTQAAKIFSARQNGWVPGPATPFAFTNLPGRKKKKGH